MDEQQARLNLIRKWIAETTEPVTDWDWDGQELVVFTTNQAVERYSNKEMERIIPGFENPFE